jgi:hypothetical protein
VDRSTSKFPFEYCKSIAFPTVDKGEEESMFNTIMLFFGAAVIVCKPEEVTPETGFELFVQLSIREPSNGGIAIIDTPSKVLLKNSLRDNFT